MKTFNFIKSLLVVVCVFVANLTISASNPEADLIYNTEEVNGVKVSETVYKMNEGILTNYEKYSYKYNDNKQVVENTLQKWDATDNDWHNYMRINYSYAGNNVTIEYYKWNKGQKAFILVPDMTVTVQQ